MAVMAFVSEAAPVQPLCAPSSFVISQLTVFVTFMPWTAEGRQSCQTTATSPAWCSAAPMLPKWASMRMMQWTSMGTSESTATPSGECNGLATSCVSTWHQIMLVSILCSEFVVRMRRCYSKREAYSPLKSAVFYPIMDTLFRQPRTM